MTSDALFMGVPVVTLRGRTMASRVAASLLVRLGVEGPLVADDLTAYVARALRLAQDDGLRRRLAATIASLSPRLLFDAQRFTRGLEAVLRTATEREWPRSI